MKLFLSYLTVVLVISQVQGHTQTYQQMDNTPRPHYTNNKVALSTGHPQVFNLKWNEEGNGRNPKRVTFQPEQNVSCVALHFVSWLTFIDLQLPCMSMSEINVLVCYLPTMKSNDYIIETITPYRTLSFLKI